MKDLIKEKPLVSIIVRTRNEEKWIFQCLNSIRMQNYKNYEVILVDNESKDNTLKKAQKFSPKIIKIKEFFPGKAINLGINNAKGEVIVCLSAHCVPVNSNWLENLIKNLSDPSVAGVYGRQEPLSYSSDFDKRDLLTVFGLDKKVQNKDPFFHNANSAFLKSTWKKFPFDEKVSNIEDRVWGSNVISKGLKIIYEPDASVFHFHGIHHNLDAARARNVVKIIESLTPQKNNFQEKNLTDLNIVAIIPTMGKLKKIKEDYLISYTIKAAKQSKYLKNIYISSDNNDLESYIKKDDKISIIKRPPELSLEHISLIEVLKFTLDKLEESKEVFDIVVCLTENYPLREPEIIDKMLKSIVLNGYDTLIAGKTETRSMWLKDKDNLQMIFNGFLPTPLKEKKVIMSLFGLCCITHPSNIREKNLFTEKTGIFEIENPANSIEFKGKDLELIIPRLKEI